MSSIEFRIAELERKLANLQLIGVISELDEAAARVKVQCGDLDTAWLPWFTRRAGGDRDWWAPEVGEQVMVLSPFGDPAQGVVLPSIYQDAHPAPASTKDKRRIEFADGGFVEYDRASGKLTINVVGDAQVDIGGKADITAEGKTTITGKATIELIGKDGGAVKGTRQGDCVCSFTGKPVVHISPTVKASF